MPQRVLLIGATEVYGEGTVRFSTVAPEDVARYAVRALFDPRAADRHVAIVPPDNLLTQHDLIDLWEAKSAAKLRGGRSRPTRSTPASRNSPLIPSAVRRSRWRSSSVPRGSRGSATDDIRAVAIRDAAQPSRIIAAVAAGTSWLVMLLVGAAAARARDTALPYPQMAPLSQYLPTSEGDEIALARSAAPLSLSGEAEIQVLGDRGYRTAVKGRNGFVCMVWRSWSDDFDDEEFWNPKVRAPICLNPSAVRTVLPEYVRRTDWVLSGLSRVEMLGRFKVAVARNEVALPAPGAMSYMMSRDGLLGDGVGHAAPHIMFFVPRAERQQWGANLPNSPIWGAEGAPDPVALFFVTVPKWSDGTPVTAH